MTQHVLPWFYAIGYLAVGPLWARTQAVRLQQVIRAERERLRRARKQADMLLTYFPPPSRVWFCKTRTAENDLLFGLAIHAVLWPISMLAAGARRVLRWSAGPVRERQRIVARLREEMADLRKQAPLMETAAIRDVLIELANEKEERAKELEI